MLNKLMQIIKITAIVIMFLICRPNAYSQPALRMSSNDYDTSYIRKFSNLWTIRLFATTKNQQNYLRDLSNNLKVSFSPNNSFSIGAGATFGNLALDLGLNIGNKDESDLSTTKSTHFQSTMSSNQHVLDLNFQMYLGFVSKSTVPFIDSNITYFRSEMRTFNFGVTYTYNFNFDKFSFNAAYLGVQEQKKSAGSFMMGGFINYFDLRSDSGLVPDALIASFDDEAEISEANILSSGLIGGYSYTLVLPHHFFITLSLSPGISANVGVAKSELYYSIGNPLTFSPKLISRNTLGYSRPRFYSLFLVNVDRNFVNIGNNNRMAFNASKLKLVVGYRI